MDKKLKVPNGESEKLIQYVKDRPGHDLRYAIDATKIKNDFTNKFKKSIRGFFLYKCKY